MSNTTTIQPSGVESIPLQPISGRTGIPDGNEDVQAEVSTSESQQTSSESQDEAQSASDPASAETDSGSGEPQPTNSTSAAEKWPLCLNATQVLIGVLAFAGFLAMVYPQIVDHFINKDSLKLSEWTAWMTFRDECRVLLNEGNDIGEDCKDVLNQPLPRPPISVDGNVPHHNGNITKTIRTASDTTFMLKRSTILLLSGSFFRRPAWLAGIFLLPLVLGFRYRKLYRTSQQQSIRRVEVYRTWVTDEVARLQPYKSIGYTTGQDTVTWLKTLRKRTTIQKYTDIGNKQNVNQMTMCFDQIPEAITNLELRDASPPPSSLVKAWDNATKNALEDGKRETANESPWLPVVVKNSGDYEGPMIARNYTHTVELILDKFNALGYQNFAFDCIEGRANLREYLGAAHQRKFPCDYSGYSSSTPGHENMGTFCSKPPNFHLDYSVVNKGHWLIKIPEFSFDTATVCLAYPSGGYRQQGTWRYWPSEGLERGLTDSPDAPCLYVMSVGPCHVRLLFENMSMQQYHTINNGLTHNKQGHRLDCCHSHESARDVESHLSLIQKVLFAASGGWLGLYSHKFTECKTGPMYEGSFGNRLDHREIGSLILIANHSSDSLSSQAALEQNTCSAWAACWPE